MRELVFFLEEISARAMLERLVPRIVPEGIAVRFVVFEGKQDLEKNLTRRLRGYLVPHARFIVLRDQDSGDCIEIKKRLADLCAAAGREETVIRIACRELESWYLGDLEAVARAFDRPALTRLAAQARYRDPDATETPSRELRRILPEYQKVDGSRRIGSTINLENNRSRSFLHFISAIRRLIDLPPAIAG